MKKVILIILFLQISGCKWFSNAHTPYFSATAPNIPDGTPTFQRGFKDGCSASTYARSNVFYRNKNKYKYDPALIGNSEYRFGHARGYTWCFQQSLAATTGAVGSWDRAIHPYGYDSTFSSGDIGSAWGGFFGGGGSIGAPVGGDVGTFMGVLNGGSPGGSLMGANPLWAGGSAGQIFGQ